MKVLGKVFVTLQSFLSSIDEQTEIKFKTKEFTIQDELKRSIGTVRLSVFVGLQKLHYAELNESETDEVYNSPMRASPNLVPATSKVRFSAQKSSNQEPLRVNEDKPIFRRGFINIEQAKDTRSVMSKQPNFDGNQTVVVRPSNNGQLNPVPISQAYRTDEEFENQDVIPIEPDVPVYQNPLRDLFVPSIKTMVEGNYCPPLLVFKRVKLSCINHLNYF